MFRQLGQEKRKRIVKKGGREQEDGESVLSSFKLIAVTFLLFSLSLGGWKWKLGMHDYGETKREERMGRGEERDKEREGGNIVTCLPDLPFHCLANELQAVICRAEQSAGWGAKQQTRN